MPNPFHTSLLALMRREGTPRGLRMACGGPALRRAHSIAAEAAEHVRQGALAEQDGKEAEARFHAARVRFLLPWSERFRAVAAQW